METKEKLKAANHRWEYLMFDEENHPGFGECCTGKYGPKCNGPQDHAIIYQRLFEAVGRVSEEIYQLEMELKTLEQKEKENSNINQVQQPIVEPSAEVIRLDIELDE